MLSQDRLFTLSSSLYPHTLFTTLPTLVLTCSHVPTLTPASMFPNCASSLSFLTHSLRQHFPCSHLSALVRTCSHGPNTPGATDITNIPPAHPVLLIAAGHTPNRLNPSLFPLLTWLLPTPPTLLIPSHNLIPCYHCLHVHNLIRYTPTTHSLRSRLTCSQSDRQHFLHFRVRWLLSTSPTLYSLSHYSFPCQHLLTFVFTLVPD